MLIGATPHNAEMLGLASVGPNAQWMLDATVILIYKFPVHTHGIFESFRTNMLWYRGFQEPTHHNVWGALARYAQAKGILVGTGSYKQMITDKSHARESEILMRVDTWKKNFKFKYTMENLITSKYK